MPIHHTHGDGHVLSRRMHCRLRDHMGLGSRVLHNVMLRIGSHRHTGAHQQTKSDPCNSLLHVLSSAPCPAQSLPAPAKKRRNVQLVFFRRGGPSSSISCEARNFRLGPVRLLRLRWRSVSEFHRSSPRLARRLPRTLAPAPALARHSTYGKSRRRTPTQAPEPAPASARRTPTAHTLRACAPAPAHAAA